MATPYSNIFELFLSSIKDYVIDKLFYDDLQNNTNKAELYMKPYLIRAIPNFDRCIKDLENRDDSSMVFNVNLDTDEQVILSNLMRLQWLTREVNDIRQMHLRLTDDAFKSYAEANNLNAKIGLLANTEEMVNKQLIQYSQKHIDWFRDFG
jgi:hypothetical protein